MRHRASALMVLFGVGVAASPFAQGQDRAAKRGTPPMTIRCVNISGSHIAAPQWQVEGDGASGQDVRLEFGGDGSPSRIVWRRSGTQYTEASGLGVSMRTGFLILVAAEDYVETYVYNPGTTELLFSATRSGSALLPNGIKAFRGTCTPAALDR